MSDKIMHDCIWCKKKVDTSVGHIASGGFKNLCGYKEILLLIHWDCLDELEKAGFKHGDYVSNRRREILEEIGYNEIPRYYNREHERSGDG